MAWMSEEAWKMGAGRYLPNESIEAALAQADRRGELISEDIMIEGLDDTLFEKLIVVEGDLSTLLQENSQSIALVADEDDYGNPSIPESYPKLGELLTITYVEEAYYIDSRTGEKSTDDTPEEYMEYYIASSRDVDYTVSAYVTLPYSMSYRYSTLGYSAVLPVNRMEQDCGQKALPMFYLFDTPDADSEEDAEEYLAELTEDDLSALMYESKASIREDFESFQNMFLLLGGVLCAIIGIVGVLNFFNAIMTGIISRRREFAVLQSVGMTNSQLKMMLVYEGMFYALGAAGAALIASVLFTPLTGLLLEKMFWFFSANFTIAPVLFAIPVFMLLGWLIPSVMYRQSMKESVVERLREAE